MPADKPSKGPDIAFAVVVMALGAIAVVEGMSIRPSRFDPLGPGAVPALIGAVLCVLAGAVLLSTVTGLRIGDGERLFTGLEPGANAQNLLWWRGLAAFAMTLAYVTLLEVRIIGYAGASFAYIACLLLSLGRRDRRGMAVALATAGTVAVALDLVFRNVLSVDLP
jgi:hypothetical protein